MVKVRLKANKEDIEKAQKDGGGDFKVPPPGIYVLTMDQCNYGLSKGDDGQPDNSRPRLECIYRIIGIGPEEAPVTENYGNLWDYVSFSDSSGWKRAEVLLAFGLMTPEENEADVEFDTDSLVNRKVIARIRHEKQTDPKAEPRARIGRLIKFGTDLSGGGLEDSAPDYGTDSPTPDEDVFGAEDGTEEEPDAYTEESLQPFTLKELGTILSEDFKGEPRDHIVKGADGKLDNDATKTAVITAILAAQGGGDAAPADEAEEDPF